MAVGPLVRLDGVHKTYREGSVVRPVLRDVDLELPVGQMTSLIGASGSGKSTLISLLAGLMLPELTTLACQPSISGRTAHSRNPPVSAR